ncbi:MAG: HupE/UreJ family protein [Ginsengibacter sp.]
MDEISLYFSIGWQHIISVHAWDHILFVTALAAMYVFKDWKKVLVLVTAFTIGHSLTLALSVYDVIRIPGNLVEFLIPVTILVTAVFNLFRKDFSHQSLELNYFFALFFGLIHGMGFANSIRFMLADSESIGIPLLSFNVGLEVGQIVIVTVILSLSFLFITLLKMQRRTWIYLLSSIALVVSIKMIFERW